MAGVILCACARFVVYLLCTKGFWLFIHVCTICIVGSAQCLDVVSGSSAKAAVSVFFIVNEKALKCKTLEQLPLAHYEICMQALIDGHDHTFLGEVCVAHRVYVLLVHVVERILGIT